VSGPAPSLFSYFRVLRAIAAGTLYPIRPLLDLHQQRSAHSGNRQGRRRRPRCSGRTKRASRSKRRRYRLPFGA
jgi:hypothetical protein